jgi:uncharacterized protein YbjT (DUF2867 family)
LLTLQLSDGPSHKHVTGFRAYGEIGLMRIAVAGGTGLVGRYVVDFAREAHHEVVVLSRSQGVDLRGGDGLDSALNGANAIIDVTNPSGADRADSQAFFAEITSRLQSVGAAHHVGHLVTLSIVGIERAPDNRYYSAKLHQEEIALAGPVPATVLRATQFHEFPVQMLRRNRAGAEAQIARMRVQSVAARTVARVLLELVSGAAQGLAPDLGGPEQAELVTLARRYVEHFGLGLTVVEGSSDATVPYGATLPGPGARLEGPTFEEWLHSEDAAQMRPDG